MRKLRLLWLRFRRWLSRLIYKEPHMRFLSCVSCGLIGETLAKSTLFEGAYVCYPDCYSTNKRAVKKVGTRSRVRRT